MLRDADAKVGLDRLDLDQAGIGLGAAPGSDAPPARDPWTRLWPDDLADAQEIAIRIHDGEFPQAPRLVFQSGHARDAGVRQAAGRAGVVEASHIEDTEIAARRGMRRHQLAMGEEMQLDGPRVKIAYSPSNACGPPSNPSRR